MTFANFAQDVIDFVREHQAWGPPIVFALAFGESLAFLSLLHSGLGGPGRHRRADRTSGISFWPIWVAGALGAALGDWVSYWIGMKIGPSVAHIWPLSRHPEMIPRAERFLERWGIAAIFIGRFFGPLRASIPLVAGIFHMPYWKFQISNVASAFVWAWVLLYLGDVGSQLFQKLWGG